MAAKSVNLSLRIQFWSVVVILLVAHVQTSVVCHSAWANAENGFGIGLALVYSIGCVLGQVLRFESRRTRLLYFGFQGIMAAALLLLSPIKGPPVYFLLPLASQAVFAFRPLIAFLVCLFLFVGALLHLALPWSSGYGVSYLPGIAGGFVFTAGFSYLVVREAAARERVEIANEQLRRSALAAEELSATRERNRIAREIHDGVGHYLTAISVQAEAAEALAPTSPERAAEHMGRVITLTRSALRDVRHSLRSLREPQGTSSLCRHLKIMIDGIPDLSVTLNVSGTETELPLTTTHALGRIVQEGLTNVRKHSGVSSASVDVDFRDPNRLSVIIGDNGKGLKEGATLGFGLNGVRERLEALGGTLHVGPNGAHGVELKALIPL